MKRNKKVQVLIDEMATCEETFISIINKINCEGVVNVKEDRMHTQAEVAMKRAMQNENRDEAVYNKKDLTAAEVAIMREHVERVPRKEMTLQTPVAVIAMAILQSYSKYYGADEVLDTADSNVLTNIRKGLYRNGYLMWDIATKDYKLTSLGEKALNTAMGKQAK